MVKVAPREKSANTAMCTVTTVAPVWNEKRQAIKKPIRKQTTASTVDHSTTRLKLRQTRIAVSAGKMTNAEIMMEPIICMPITMVTAVRIAIRDLYRSVRIPVALENVSSNVTAKILL